VSCGVGYLVFLCFVGRTLVRQLASWQLM
jgi:hypothetical protein